MIEEQKNLSYEWWVKLRPLVNKFIRETILYGLERDDLEQECYLQLHKALERFDKKLGVPFESYYKIRLYGWRSNQNKKKREILFEGEQMPFQADERINIEEIVETKLLLERIYKEMEKLEQEEREIILSYYIEGKEISEIAKALGVNYRTVVYRKGEVLKKLARKISLR